MTPIELLANAAEQNLEWLKMTLGDFSDADMLVRPCPGANHAMWQLGHMISSETFMINSAQPGTMPELPPGHVERFDAKAAGVDDPTAFPKKAELIDLATRTRSATCKWIRSLSQSDLEKPAAEKMRAYVPTIGHLVLMQSGHTTMHMGQMQAIRRKLGKPVLF